ncbi:MAG TPA: hypothetical protein VFB38_16005 [Chthonomonadaceae bacterium]|nr:hypothetical protein [Chthonomonadaceae bacterium]
MRKRIQTQVFEGTWEEIKLHEQELIGKRLRVIVEPEERKMPARKGTQAQGSERQPKNRERPSILGKYAFVPGGSEEFMREKQEEIAREDRPRS